MDGYQGATEKKHLVINRHYHTKMVLLDFLPEIWVIKKKSIIEKDPQGHLCY